MGQFAPPDTTSPGCWFAWYWEFSSDGVSEDLSIVTPNYVPGYLNTQIFSQVLGIEGGILSSAAGNAVANYSAFACQNLLPYYRWQCADLGLPWMRAEVYAEHPLHSLLPSRLNQGYQYFAVWLTDQNPGCIKTAAFKGVSWPRFTFNVTGIVGNNGSAAGIVTGKLQESFIACAAADNDLWHRFLITGDGTMFDWNLSLSLAIPPAVSVGGGSSTPTVQVPWSNNEVFMSTRKESPWVSARADRLLLLGQVQSQMRVSGGFGLNDILNSIVGGASAATVLHTALYDSDHGASLTWRATPSGAATPTAPPLPPLPTPPGGSTPPRGGSNGSGVTPVQTSPWPGPYPPEETSHPKISSYRAEMTAQSS
jgi:hypothetical protein